VLVVVEADAVRVKIFATVAMHTSIAYHHCLVSQNHQNQRISVMNNLVVVVCVCLYAYARTRTGMSAQTVDRTPLSLNTL
jgi:hypothetical protein